MRAIFLVTAISLLGLQTVAFAKPIQTTKYRYNTINGNSADEIYKAMIKRGPEVDGVNAYASTKANLQQEGKLQQVKTCLVSDYRVKLDFTITLPKLKNENALKGQVKTQWQNFSAFVKTHEETHRTIWTNCAAKMEKQAVALRVKTCDGLNQKTLKLWEQMRKSCSREHAAFDAAEQKRLLKHPFIKLVRGR